MANTATGLVPIPPERFQCYEAGLDVWDSLMVVGSLMTCAVMVACTCILWANRFSHPMATFIKPLLLWPISATSVLWMAGQLFSSVHLRWPWAQSSMVGCTTLSRLMPGILGEGITVTIVLYRLYDVAVVHVHHRTATRCMRFLLAWPLLSQVALTAIAYAVPGAMQDTQCADVACMASPELGAAIFASYFTHLLVLVYFARMSRALWATFVTSNTMYGAAGVVTCFMFLVAGFSIFMGPATEAAQTTFTAAVLVTINVTFFGHVGSTVKSVLYRTRLIPLFSDVDVVAVTEEPYSPSPARKASGGAGAGAGAGESTTSRAVQTLRKRWADIMHEPVGAAPRLSAQYRDAGILTSQSGTTMVTTIRADMQTALSNPLESEAFIAYVRIHNAHLANLYKDIQTLRTEGRLHVRKKLRLAIQARYLNTGIQMDPFMREYASDVYRTVPQSGVSPTRIHAGGINRLERAPRARMRHGRCSLQWIFDTFVRMPLAGCCVRACVPRCLRMPRPTICCPSPSPLVDQEALVIQGVTAQESAAAFRAMPTDFVVHGVNTAIATLAPDDAADEDLLRHLEVVYRALVHKYNTGMQGNTTLFQDDGADTGEPILDIQKWVLDYFACVYWPPYVRMYFQDICQRQNLYRGMLSTAQRRGFTHVDMDIHLGLERGIGAGGGAVEYTSGGTDSKAARAARARATNQVLGDDVFAIDSDSSDNDGTAAPFHTRVRDTALPTNSVHIELVPRSTVAGSGDGTGAGAGVGGGFATTSALQAV